MHEGIEQISIVSLMTLLCYLMKRGNFKSTGLTTAGQEDHKKQHCRSLTSWVNSSMLVSIQRQRLLHTIPSTAKTIVLNPTLRVLHLTPTCCPGRATPIGVNILLTLPSVTLMLYVGVNLTLWPVLISLMTPLGVDLTPKGFDFVYAPPLVDLTHLWCTRKATPAGVKLTSFAVLQILQTSYNKAENAFVCFLIFPFKYKITLICKGIHQFVVVVVVCLFVCFLILY